MGNKVNSPAWGIVLMLFLLILPLEASAHCDTMDGPVVKDAQKALEKGDVTPVLKWVRGEDEKEIRRAFEKTLLVRSKGAEAMELADRYFMETLVRVHRAGEGAPYTGLKPAGSIDPAVAMADEALVVGPQALDKLVQALSAHMDSGIRQRFAEALEKKKSADKSVKQGREFIHAYVEYVHYVERLHNDIKGETPHTHAPQAVGEDTGHKH